MESSEEPRLERLSAEAPRSAKEPREHGERVHLAPRNGAEIVDLGIWVLMRRFLPCLAISVALWIPVRIAMPFVLRAMPSNSFDNEQLVVFWAGLFGVGLFARLVEIIVTMSLSVLAYEFLVGREVSALEALTRALRRGPALVGLFLLQTLILSAGSGLLVALGVMCPPLFLGALVFWVYFSWKLTLAPSLLVLEELSLSAALSRSFSLSKGSLLRWIVVGLLAVLFSSWFSAGIQPADNELIRSAALEGLGIPPLLYDVALVPITAVFSGVATAILAVAWTAFYLDARIRREGLDLRMRLERRAQETGL